MAASVVGAIAPKLEQAESVRAARKPTASLDAYDYYLRGRASWHKGYNYDREAIGKSRACSTGRSSSIPNSPRHTAWPPGAMPYEGTTAG